MGKKKMTRKKYCEWKYIKNEYYDDENYYQTECDGDFYFTNDCDLRDDTQFKFCPYCGKPIKVKGEK